MFIYFMRFENPAAESASPEQSAKIAGTPLEEVQTMINLVVIIFIFLS
jgi:hypothetical protein